MLFPKRTHLKSEFPVNRAFSGYKAYAGIVRSKWAEDRGQWAEDRALGLAEDRTEYNSISPR